MKKIFNKQRKKIINPKPKEDKILANVNRKDREKRIRPSYEIDEGKSDGSANAFERTEEVTDDE
jgi:hypothetical protein